MRTAIAINTSKPTRSSPKPTLLVRAMRTNQGKSKKVKSKTISVEITFIPFPFPFFLSSMSAQKLLDVLIFRTPQAFIGATENHPPIAHHQHFAVNQTEFFAFLFEDHFTRLVDDGVL